MVHNVGVYAVRKLKVRRISTRREQNRRFYSDIVLQVREKSAILRFKAKDEALSSTLNSDGHKHFVGHSYFILRIIGAERVRINFRLNQF